MPAVHTTPARAIATPTTTVPVLLLIPPVTLGAPTSGKTVRVVICRSASKSRPHPLLYVVDGQTIGQRPDGTIDHVVASRWLAQLDVRSIVSITLVKSITAVERYGPGAHEGAAEITTTRAAFQR
jgi:hypothetical protein